MLFRSAAASVLAALQAGICHFEATMGGLGGQPANFLDDCPVPGTGDYYYNDPRYVGLICPEDLLVQTRYRESARPARIELSGGALRVRFNEPQVRPAPGQVAAVYDTDGVVLAGAVIA